MGNVDVDCAKSRLSELLDRVASGEEVVITRNGQSIAKLVALAPSTRKPGSLRGQLRMKQGFDEPLPVKIVAAFSGGSPMESSGSTTRKR